MIDIDRYHHLLEINKNANPQEIKQAYFVKAKDLHANYQISQKAQEAFIALTEAYEVVSGKMQKKLKSKSFDYDSWMKEVKNKADFYAEKKQEDFEKFINEDYNYLALVRIGKVIGGIFSAVFIVGILYMGYVYGGFAVSAFLIIITSPITVSAILYALEILKVGGLQDDSIATFKNPLFQMVLVSIINLYLFLTIGLQTLITLQTYAIIFFGLIFFVYGWLHFRKVVKKTSSKVLYAFGVTPLCINILLTINFLGSSNPVQETYQFTQETRYMNRNARPESYGKKSSRIFLDEKGASKYGNYIGIQTFEDYTEILNSDTIIYTFEDGLLGIKVMKDYKFIPYAIEKPLLEKNYRE